MTKFDRSIFSVKLMARNTSQGTGARHGTPRSPVPALNPASTSEDRLTQLEDALQDVRLNSHERFESINREIAGIHIVLEARGHEMKGYAKIEELDELRRRLENVRQARSSEHVRTSSHDHERQQPVPMYYGKRKDLSAFLNLFLHWAVSHNVEAALTSDVSVVMTTQKSRNELYDRYGRDIVDNSLTAWKLRKTVRFPLWLCGQNPLLMHGHYCNAWSKAMIAPLLEKARERDSMSYT